MNVEFYKMHGAGNDFIVIDNRPGNYSDWKPEFIRGICLQHTGIGADGLLMIENTPEADFRMRFFNSDGFEADMCVNGSRCICFLAHQLGIIGKDFTFLAGDGPHPGRILPGARVKIRVLIKPVSDERTFPVDFKLPDSLYFKRFLNTGVPHVVLEVSDLSVAPVKEIGDVLRFHAYYQPEGTNVNFVQVVSRRLPFGLKMRTYERGVDAETMSCGTGATAAALSFFSADGDKRSEVYVDTPGGQLLVSFTGRGDEIYLEGPVRIVYKGTYFKEEF